MAVNSFNPRLFSSSSSENDVDEVFRHKAGSVVPVGGMLPTAKNRCFSEPVSQNGKDGKKGDLKTFGKAPALSDSSNVIRRERGRIVSQVLSDNPSSTCEKNSECSPVFEELPSVNLEKSASGIDNVFPEPEYIREATKDPYRFSILLEEEEESINDMIPNLGQEQDTGDSGLMEFADGLNHEGTLENDVFYMRDVALGSTREDATLIAEEPAIAEDDDSYPEKEFIPSGFISCATQDLPFVLNSWDLPRTILRSYPDEVAELPDDLFKDTAIYPVDMENDFENLSPVALPSTPIVSSDYELKMKLFIGKNC